MAIVAISSAPSSGGIGIIRMSGEDSFDILDKVFKPKFQGEDKNIKGYTMKYGHIVDKSEIIDEVLVSYFVKPKSYTTENMVEINSHGGIANMNNILELLISKGAVLAQPGEFTKLAFLNGRIDLTQAESVIDIINATSKSELKVSQNVLNGGLSDKINEIKKIIINILTDIDVSIDYPEYDETIVDNLRIVERLGKVEDLISKLISSYANGKVIKDGLDTAIIGMPNVGKSSLLNNLLNEQRAIVTNIAGTTRDTIEEQISINGLKLNLIDTAGIRKTDELIEKMRIEKSIEYINKASLILYLLDVSQELSEENIEILEKIKDKKYIICLNKIDVEGNFLEDIKEYLTKNGFSNIIEMSISENVGIDKLRNLISKMFNLNNLQDKTEIIITNQRHKAILEKALEETRKAKQEIQNEMPEDLVAISLNNILFNLNEIIGINISDEVINNIFSKFCLGK